MTKILSNEIFLLHTTLASVANNSLDNFTLNNDLGVKILKLNDFLTSDKFVNILELSFKGLKDLYCIKLDYDYDREPRYAYVLDNYHHNEKDFKQEIKDIIRAFNIRNKQNCKIETIFNIYRNIDNQL